jgi:hypothetical protein
MVNIQWSIINHGIDYVSNALQVKPHRIGVHINKFGGCLFADTPLL